MQIFSVKDSRNKGLILNWETVKLLRIELQMTEDAIKLLEANEYAGMEFTYKQKMDSLTNYRDDVIERITQFELGLSFKESMGSLDESLEFDLDGFARLTGIPKAAIILAVEDGKIEGHEGKFTSGAIRQFFNEFYSL